MKNISRIYLKKKQTTLFSQLHELDASIGTPYKERRYHKIKFVASSEAFELFTLYAELNNPHIDTGAASETSQSQCPNRRVGNEQNVKNLNTKFNGHQVLDVFHVRREIITPQHI